MNEKPAGRFAGFGRIRAGGGAEGGGDVRGEARTGRLTHAVSFSATQTAADAALLAAAIAAGVWWLGFIPYDPLAIHRPVPAAATVVGGIWHCRTLGRPAGESLLALAVMRTAGWIRRRRRRWRTTRNRGSGFDAGGREGVLAYLPGHGPGRRRPDGHAWPSGRESQKLRWQLPARCARFRPVDVVSCRSVWRVDTPDLIRASIW